MMLLGDNSEASRRPTAARTFLAMRAPGVIMTPVGSEATALLASHGVAVVEVDRRLARVPCDAVVIDNERGAREATAHLLELGHRRDRAARASRRSGRATPAASHGYRAAHAEAGVAVDER